MPTSEPRLVWSNVAHWIFAPKEPGTGYLLQMWQTRPENWPLVFWETDGYSLAEAKSRAERLADHQVPAITQKRHRHMLEVGGGECSKWPRGKPFCTMADEGQLKILRQGVATCNVWHTLTDKDREAILTVMVMRKKGGHKVQE